MHTVLNHDISLSQLLPVHQGWYINNVVHHVLRHVILMKIQIVVVVVLKGVSVQLGRCFLKEIASMHLTAKVQVYLCFCYCTSPHTFMYYTLQRIFLKYISEVATSIHICRKIITKGNVKKQLHFIETSIAMASVCSSFMRITFQKCVKTAANPLILIRTLVCFLLLCHVSCYVIVLFSSIAL